MFHNGRTSNPRRAHAVPSPLVAPGCPRWDCPSWPYDVVVGGDVPSVAKDPGYSPGVAVKLIQHGGLKVGIFEIMIANLYHLPLLNIVDLEMLGT